MSFTPLYKLLVPFVAHDSQPTMKKGMLVRANRLFRSATKDGGFGVRGSLKRTRERSCWPVSEREKERERNPYAVAARQHAVVLAARPFSFMISRGRCWRRCSPVCTTCASSFVATAATTTATVKPPHLLPRFQCCRPTMLRDVHIRAQVLLFLVGRTGKSPKAKRYNQNRARDPALRCLILLELDRFRFSFPSFHFFFLFIFLSTSFSF